MRETPIVPSKPVDPYSKTVIMPKDIREESLSKARVLAAKEKNPATATTGIMSEEELKKILHESKEKSNMAKARTEIQGQKGKITEITKKEEQKQAIYKAQELARLQQESDNARKRTEEKKIDVVNAQSRFLTDKEKEIIKREQDAKKFAELDNFLSGNAKRGEGIVELTEEVAEKPVMEIDTSSYDKQMQSRQAISGFDLERGGKLPQMVGEREVLKEGLKQIATIQDVWNLYRLAEGSEDIGELRNISSKLEGMLLDSKKNTKFEESGQIIKDTPKLLKNIEEKIQTIKARKKVAIADAEASKAGKKPKSKSSPQKEKPWYKFW